jgi:hypothetical protein
MNSEIDNRLARIESRLVQLMLHMGLNPYEKQYDARPSNRVAPMRHAVLKKVGV